MKFLKGMDISTLKEVESLGGRFFDHGQEKDVLDILQSYDVNAVRLRLWNNPYTEDGEPYGAGTNDLSTTIELTKRALAKGMEVLLDFHYSDFWADPGKQRVPRAWQGMNLEELEEAVYRYTKETLETMRAADAFPTLVQIGNEVTNGILWPYGRVPEYGNLARLLNAGIRGARAADKDIPLMIHLDNGGNNALYREWFDHFMEKGGDFQIIGLSYYPFWHGTLDDLAANMSDLAVRYGKELMIAEVSMGRLCGVRKTCAAGKKGHGDKTGTCGQSALPDDEGRAEAVSAGFIREDEAGSGRKGQRLFLLGGGVDSDCRFRMGV